MSFWFLLLFILFLVTDMVIGLYLAILFGYGPPTFRYAVGMFFSRHDVAPLLDRIVDIRNRLIAMLPGFLRKFLSSPTTEAETSKIAEAAPVPTVEESIEAMANADLADLLIDEADQLMQVSPMQEIFDDDLASVLMEQGTEAWLMNEKNIETSILKLNAVMMKSGRFSSNLDLRLRAMRGRADATQVRQCLQEMKDDYSSYLENQAAVSDRIRRRADEFGELAYLVEELEYANMEQASQIETTLNNLDQIALRGTAEEGVSRMIKELGTLRAARHRLRDMQDRAFLALARYENRLDIVSPQLFVDEATGLRNRIGLDVALHEWWRQGRQEKRKLTFALLDFVKFGDLNAEYGIDRCDRLLGTFGRMLEKAFDPLDLVALYAGGVFFVATVNMGPRKTMTEIDRIRQQMMKTTFTDPSSESQGNDPETSPSSEPVAMNILLTCAVMEVPAATNDVDVLVLLDKTLAAAKKAGDNRTFIYDSYVLEPKPEPLDAPDFGAESVVMPLEQR